MKLFLLCLYSEKVKQVKFLIKIWYIDLKFYAVYCWNNEKTKIVHIINRIHSRHSKLVKYFFSYMLYLVHRPYIYKPNTEPENLVLRHIIPRYDTSVPLRHDTHYALCALFLIKYICVIKFFFRKLSIVSK